MRPYFAIIKDSFRAAMASRVLYVLLVLITILLLAIAPFHMRETLDWELSGGNVRNPDRLLRRIVAEKNEKPIARIWDSLSAKMQKKLTTIVERKDDGSASEASTGMPETMMDAETHQFLIREINSAIKDSDFYQEADWEKTLLPSEAEELIKSGNLTETRSRRLNRLLIATAVSPEIETGQKTALEFFYAVWPTWIGPVGMTHQEFAQMLTSTLPVYFDKFVLSIGLLIAVLVTANLIPETFEAGSLNLLLSKPISRWGLYVAKFVGGCAFVALCACYLFLGVWLWMGIGMGVWDRAMLLSIPLYIIVFAIYFSVSAFVGLLWRSAIVSVILTLLFWACCFSAGAVNGLFSTKMENTNLRELLPVQEQVLATDMLHQLQRWDDSEAKWDSITEAELGDQGEGMVLGLQWMMPLQKHPALASLRDYLPPIYDRENQRVITSRYEFGQFLSTGQKKMLVAETSGENTDLDKLNFKQVGAFPRDTVKVFETKNGIVAASSNGSFYRLDEERLKDAMLRSDRIQSEAAASKKLADEKKEKAKVVSSKADADGEQETKPETSESESESSKPEAIADDSKESDADDDTLAIELFKQIGPTKPAFIREVSHVDYSPTRDEFVIYQRGVLKVFAASEGKYQARASLELDLDFNKSMTALVAYPGSTVVVAFGNGKVLTVDAEKLEEKVEYQPETRSATVQVKASESGRYFGVLYRNGNLWLLDTESGDEIKKADVSGQGDVCSFSISADDQLWVATDSDQVALYDLSGGTSNVRYAPSGTMVEKIYRYGVRPFYRICPKPGEFYKVVTHLSSSGDTEFNANVDLNRTEESTNPWSPLWTGLGFMIMMLTFGCIVFHFKDY
ncbi:MAG: ABC transporter permease subunit [Mariniblastus sp.]